MIIAIVMGSCAALALLMVPILGAVMFPVFSRARDSARASSCQSNAKQLALGLMMYAQDWDEQFPPAASWAKGAQVYTKNATLTECPTFGPGKHAYAYNSWMSGRSLGKVSSPAEEPLFFESRLNKPNGADAMTSFDPRHIYGGGKAGVVAFVDGHVRLLPSAPDAKAGLPSSR
jgi:prepilin-type processing-associated H-X9-DG protein